MKQRIDWDFEVGDNVDYVSDEVEVVGRIFDFDKEEHAYLIFHNEESVMEYKAKQVLEEYSEIAD